jgi:radical SAM protein with 4Fe4S-binding SPASM domain
LHFRTVVLFSADDHYTITDKFIMEALLLENGGPLSQQELNEESSPYAPPNLLFKESTSGAYLLLDPDTPNWIVVDKVGKAIVSRCNGSVSIAEITRELCREYKESYEESIEYILHFVNELQKRNLLRNKPFPEVQRADKAHSKLNEIWIHVTNECNLRCIHCHLSSGIQLQNELTIEEIFGAIAAANELGAQRIIISGGEPLMRKDFLSIAKFSRDKVGFVQLLTNGTLITDKIAQALKDWDIKVQVSLDGARKETNDFIRGKGAYERTIAGIKKLVKSGVDTRLSMTLMEKNMNEIPEMAVLAEKLGIKMLHIPTPQIKGRARENKDSVLPSDESCIKLIKSLDGLSKIVGINVFLEEFWYLKIEKIQKIDLCGAGCMLMSIAADGEVYPCAGLHEMEFSSGNIREKSLKDMWENSEVFKELRSFSVLDIPECRDCEMKFICGGGCHVDRYYAYGDLRRKSPLCGINYELSQYSLLKQANDIHYTDNELKTP